MTLRSGPSSAIAENRYRGLNDHDRGPNHRYRGLRNSDSITRRQCKMLEHKTTNENAMVMMMMLMMMLMLMVMVTVMAFLIIVMINYADCDG